MPKELEHKLMMAAKKKGLSKQRMNAYVYGTLRKVENQKKKTNKMSKTKGKKKAGKRK